MRTVNFNRSFADVQSVEKRKSLRRAVVVALLAGTVAVPAGAWAETILFQDDFESGNLSKWSTVGSAKIVNDPLENDHAITFMALKGGGDIFSSPISNSTGKYTLSFDYLGLQKTGSVSDDFGGFVGFNPTWLAGTNANYVVSTYEGKPVYHLQDSGKWQHHTLNFKAGTNIQLMLEDTYLFGGVTGDVFFDNIVLSVAVDPACDTVTNGLVACYPFDGNANDGSGNGNHGTAKGGVTSTTDRLGNTNSAYRLNGVNGYIEAANSPTLNVGTGDYSMAMWVLYQGTGQLDFWSVEGVLLDKREPVNAKGFSFYFTPGRLGTQVADNGRYHARNFEEQAVLEDNQWHHVVATVERNNTTGLKLYLDGKLIATRDPTAFAGNLDNPGTFKIGHSYAHQPYPFNGFLNGSVDDVRLYKRAITEAEIKQLYGVASTEIVATPPATICAGSTFDVTIRINKTDAQAIDGADIALKFDKSKLKVNKVTDSGVFDTVLDNKYDNTTGDITFTAGAWNKPAATSSFDLFTINFTALSSTAGTTLLDFVNDSILLTSGGQAVTTTATDQALTLNQCLNYKVNLQRANPIGNPSWITPMKVSLGSATSAVEYDTTCDVNGLGRIILSKPVATGDYLCVKNSHTLANRVIQPFGNPVDFSTLLEGDAIGKNLTPPDNAIDMYDLSFSTNHKGCKGAAGTQYDPQADFNVSGCVDQADLTLYLANYKKPSACKQNDSLKMYRKGERKGENTLTLNAMAVPTNLKVGDSFDYTIQVNANQTQPADGVALYLNFDPTQFRVNRLTTDPTFDVTLENTFDNAKGEINVAAGVWQNQAPTTSVDLVTINFTALQAGEHAIAFNDSDERATIITHAGEDVMGFSENGKIIVEPIATAGDYTASGQLLGRTGIPLGNVTIHIGEKTTTTDAAGNWSLNGLTAGKYDIVATKGKQSCVDSAVELLDNGQYQQMVNYACDLVSYGDETATAITIWQYIGTMPVEEFDAKYQEGKDYLFSDDDNGDFLLQGIDDQGKTTRFSGVKVKTK